MSKSVQRLATGSTVRGSNSGGGNDFLHPSRETMGAHSCTCTESFPVVKREGRGVSHPPPSTAEVKQKIRAIPRFTLHGRS